MVLWGGQTLEHSRAQEDAWRKLLVFLRKNLYSGAKSRDSILEPLSFPELGAGSPSTPSVVQYPSDELLVCLFCSESVPLLQKDTLLRHLLLEHKLVIADIKLIANLPR
uniref:BAAT/Acyl-CoA thioester hydrolase C-terminal domain-containing protein n=1 Tax=Xiphophorus couchianus TaxID=32473 RepID=A0A3B5LI50_9TELE